MDAHEPSSPPPSTGTERLEARHDGQVVASADVRSAPEPHGTAQIAVQRHRDDAPAEVRSELVDRVMDSAGVSSSDSVHVVLPLGDAPTITRLQERTTDYTARAAGSSSIVDAQVPAAAEASRPSE